MSLNQGKGWNPPTASQAKPKASGLTALGIAAPARKVAKRPAEGGKEDDKVEADQTSKPKKISQEPKKMARLETSLFAAGIPTQEQVERLTPISASTAGEKATKIFRTVAGEVWDDPTMADWNPHDFRLFVGNIGNEVADVTLRDIFSVYPTFDRARVVRDKNGKTRGFGFASFLEAKDFLRALKEWNGQYIGNRPCMLKRSTWDERSVKNPKKVQRAPEPLKYAKK